MSFLVWFLLSIGLLSCGTENSNPPEVRLIVEEFEREFRVYVPNGSVRFGSKQQLKNDEVGVCNWLTRTITLSREFWGRSSNNTQRLLLYHELGHCVLGRVNHIDDRYPDGCPKSIMSTRLMPDACYFAHQEEVDKELRYPSHGYY